MEPQRRLTRPNSMNRNRLLTATPLLLAGLLLGACGSDTGADSSADGEPTTSSTPTASPTPSTATTESPSTPPPTGPNPPYAPTDYSYTLRVSCFCPSAGAPARITVTDGEVSDAVWLRASRDHAKGEAITDDWHRLTIQDIIDAANDPDAADIKVEWPDGQDYPSRVSIDQDKLMVDEERSYAIADIELT